MQEGREGGEGVSGFDHEKGQGCRKAGRGGTVAVEVSYMLKALLTNLSLTYFQCSRFFSVKVECFSACSLQSLSVRKVEL